MSENQPCPSDRVRIVQINNSFLCELLKFPPGTQIIGYNVAASWQRHLPDLELKVLHPDFDPVRPGNHIAYVSPRYEQNKVGDVWVTEFVCW